MSDSEDNDVSKKDADTEQVGTNAVPSNYKTRGKISDQDATGVVGHSTSGSGAGKGVFGQTEGWADGATGVRGVANNQSGRADGVVGISSGKGYFDTLNAITYPAIGVTGRATNSNAEVALGVYGVTASPSNYDAGVRGVASANNGEVYGVEGTTYSSDGNATGVEGWAFQGSGATYGVRGTTDSTNNNAAGVRAVGQSGVGLSVEGINRSSGGTDPNLHVASIEDRSGSNARVLALKMGESTPSVPDNFITFLASDNTQVGEIRGDNSGGVDYRSASADYAEYMPRLDPAEDISPAEVVGVQEGQVTTDTSASDQAMVVSDQAIVTGNTPGFDPGDTDPYEKIAFVGQVPVRVRGTVDRGDIIVPSGDHDGTAVAVAADEFAPTDGPIVGRAWDGTDDTEVDEVTVSVGLETGDAFAEALERQESRIEELERESDAKDDRIAALEAETAALRTENEELRDQLCQIDERVAALTDNTSSPAPADD